MSSSRFSPAALALMAAGVSAVDVAAVLGVTPAAVSRKLKGELGGLTPDLVAAIIKVGGIAVATAVATAYTAAAAEEEATA